MREIVIQIPTLDAEQNIEIDVKINGKKKTLKYRVELVSWESQEEMEQDRVMVLKQIIREYDKDWELVQIGAPTEVNIPVMFRKKLERKPA